MSLELHQPLYVLYFSFSPRWDCPIEVGVPGACILILKNHCFQSSSKLVLRAFNLFQSHNVLPRTHLQLLMFRGQCHLHVMYSFFSISSMPTEVSRGCVCVCIYVKKKKAVNHSISYVKKKKKQQACWWPVVHCDVYCNLCCSIKLFFFSLAKH